MRLSIALFTLVLTAQSLIIPAFAQQDPIVAAIIKEANDNSQLKRMSHELMDGVGPRLVGSTKMMQASDWAIAQYQQYGITARRENYGTWRGWDRGITHVDMISPWTKSLEATQLAFSPSTKKAVKGETIILADVTDSIAFQQWLPNVKGKFVLVSMPQPTGRPDYNWKEFATKASMDKMLQERKEQTEAWRKRISKTGYNNRTLAAALEKAGAAGIIGSNWSQGFGVNKIFDAYTKKIPTIDVMLEDYGLLYRLTESGAAPMISVLAKSKELGEVPTFNTLGEIKGTEKSNEYVMLSAHFDSWDGGTGATDNGTGTMVMMEAMRILKKVYPNPKRTILVGHWGSEEQGLNGSRAFVEDHPEVVNNLQALFNQDNGTGRIINLGGSGFAKAKDYVGRWLAAVPGEYKDSIKTSFPGAPGGGGSDHASFVAVGAPAFSLGALNWSYFNYTWHTNRDTYDKIVFDDLRNNAIVTAILVYMACEDPERSSNEKAELKGPGNRSWPAQVKAKRRGVMISKLLSMNKCILTTFAILICKIVSAQFILDFKKPATNPLMGPDSSYSFFCPVQQKEVKWQKADVFNPAAIVRNDTVFLLFRAEDNKDAKLGHRTSRIGLAHSTDGINFKRYPKPVLYPDLDDMQQWDYPGGCEDPRVVQTEDGNYLMLYTSWNSKVARLSSAISKDLIYWKKQGPVFLKAHEGKFNEGWSKSGSVITKMVDGKIVAAKMNGKYWMYWGENFVNLAYSENLQDWYPLLDKQGELLKVMETRPYKFDSHLVECGPPAIITDEGILLIYNGRNIESEIADPNLPKGMYASGQALFDKNDPSKFIKRLDQPFMKPDLPHEITGQYKAGTTFAEGLVRFKNQWFLYYGTADSMVGVTISK